MKKTALLILSALLLVSITACSQETKKTETKTESATTEAKKDEKTAEIAKEPAKDILGKEDEWVVPNQWKLKIDSVKVTKERNEYHDTKPAEVVIVTYTYENLGYKGDTQDLFLTPSNAIDVKGEMSETYPAILSSNPKPTPIGAKCVKAQEAFGLNNASDKIKILFELYDNSGTQQKTTFEIPVEK